MQRTHFSLVMLFAALLTACTTTGTAPPAKHTDQIKTTEEAPQVAPPAPATEAKPVTSKELAEEAQRLLGMQKNYFSVFRIEEAGVDLKPRQNAIGVFDLRKDPRGERLRLTIAQQPKSPARLAIGTYTVTLDLFIEYIEVRACRSASCDGKQQRIVRKLPKLLQIQISPQNQYIGGKDISLADFGSAERNDKNYKSTYSNVVITVKRISVVAASSPA